MFTRASYPPAVLELWLGSHVDSCGALEGTARSQEQMPSPSTLLAVRLEDLESPKP